jgi:pyruvate/2-oxoglutarate/acetoin dehydrogenase E1 component
MTSLATPVAAAEAGAGVEERTGAEAVRTALEELMASDERVFLMGEDIGVYGGAFGVTAGLLERFGAARVRDTPIAESAIVGAGIGAALTGLRPIVEIQFSDFVVNAMDMLVNQAAKIHYMLGGVPTVPLVVRLPTGAGTGAAAQHSQSLEAWFVHVPGLKVVMPSNPADARNLLHAAVADPNPVLFLEHKLLYKTSGPVPAVHDDVPLGVARTLRHGEDLTIVATGIMVGRSLEAADRLAVEGIEVTVVDPCTLKPLDEATIISAVSATGRLLVVQEAPPRASFAAEVTATVVASKAFHHLLAPVERLCGLDAPIPYAPQLERAAVPQVDDIVRRAGDLVRRSR